MPAQLVQAWGFGARVMSQASYFRDQVDVLARLSRDVKEPEETQEIVDELRIMASVAYVVNLAAALDKSAGPKLPSVTRIDDPLSRALGATRLGTVKVNGRHRIRAQYGRGCLPEAEASSASD